MFSSTYRPTIEDARGIEYRQIDVGADPAADVRMLSRSGRTSMPQVFIDGLHVGGSDDLAAADASGLLARLVSRAA